MARIPGGFNAEGQKTMDDRSWVKPGRYLAEIEKTDYKQNSNKNGYFVYLQRKLIQAENADNETEVNKKMFTNLNVDHPNVTAMEIANKEFTSTCIACGVIAPEDTDELIGIPHWIEVGIKKGKKKDDPDQNVILKIEAFEGAAGVVKANTPAKPSAAVTGTVPGKPRKPIFED